MSRRVVITGIGLSSPLGNSPDTLWAALTSGTSGVRELSSLPGAVLPTRFGGEAIDFTGAIEDFGPLEKTMSRNIKKSLKMMCREMQMGVAVAQLALTDSKLPLAALDRDRVGVVYGSDYMLTMPQEFAAGNRNCLDASGQFQQSEWGEKGLPAVEPLWLLKYLPNLPASHIAIFNDLHGPSNSLTMREASSNLAVAEAYYTIVRGHADAIIAGANGTLLHPGRTVTCILERQIATGDGEPSRLSRPFDLNRSGQILGEGAAALILEELSAAQARGAKILGEVIGVASSAAADKHGVAQYKTAIGNVLRALLANSGLAPNDVGHVHAHGLASQRCDAEEAQAIAQAFEKRKSPVPVVAAKSYFGNLGAASGLVELIASLLALQHGRLFRTLNYETPDPQCPVHIAADGDSPGTAFLNLNVSPQGQASGVAIRQLA
jgi:3-oxoacyl-[acyl-carrier-protein] synthase II